CRGTVSAGSGVSRAASSATTADTSARSGKPRMRTSWFMTRSAIRCSDLEQRQPPRPAIAKVNPQDLKFHATVGGFHKQAWGLELIPDLDPFRLLGLSIDVEQLELSIKERADFLEMWCCFKYPFHTGIVVEPHLAVVRSKDSQHLPTSRQSAL